MSLGRIRTMVSEWFGVRDLPMTILTKEAEIVKYEMEHPEVHPGLWEWVDHDLRLVRMWSRVDMGIELVVFHCDQYKLVQDVCFRDAFRDAEEWREAVLNLIRTNPRVWVVDHDV